MMIQPPSVDQRFVASETIRSADDRLGKYTGFHLTLDAPSGRLVVAEVLTVLDTNAQSPAEIGLI